MGCDCKKTYSIGMGCCQPVLAPADNFYTKYQTDMRIEEAISGITVSGITEEQAEEMIEEATSGKANSSDVYTKQETDTLLDNKLDASAYTPTDLSNYYTKDESDNKYQPKGDYVTGEQMSAYTYDKQTIDDKIASGGSESKEIVAGRGIKVTTGETADTVAFDLPIYTGRTLDPHERPYNYLKIADGLLVSTSEDDIFFQGYERKFAVGQGWSGLTAYDFLVDYNGKIYIDDYKDVDQYGRRNTYCLQDKLDSLQPILSAGTGIDIANNVISVTGGSQPVDAYTKAESDAKFATITNFNSHSGDTTVHITAQERTTWNAKPNVWCGNESDWSQISGSTESGTIYLVY